MKQILISWILMLLAMGWVATFLTLMRRATATPIEEPKVARTSPAALNAAR